MDRFPVGDIFYLTLLQSAIGAFWLYALVPVKEVGNGFFLTTTRPFWIATLLALVAHGGGRWDSLPGSYESAAAWCFFGFLSLYLAGVWLDRVAWEYQGWWGGMLTGFLTMVLTARYFLADAALGIQLLGVAQFILSALVLGGVMLGMLVGHWYLVVPKLSIDPFRRVMSLLVKVLWLMIAVIGAALALAFFLGGEAAAQVQSLFGFYWPHFVGRVLFGLVATMAPAIMTQRTLDIPHTQAATGIIYIAILFAIAGELWGRYLMLVTQLPV